MDEHMFQKAHLGQELHRHEHQARLGGQGTIKESCGHHHHLDHQLTYRHPRPWSVHIDAIRRTVEILPWLGRSLGHRVHEAPEIANVSL